MFGINSLDIVVAIIFITCIMIGMIRGFLRTAFSFVSILVSFYIARAIYQPVSAFLRENTPIYELLKAQIILTLRIHTHVERYIQQGEGVVIDRLPLPQVVLERLAQNNTPATRLMMGVTTLEEYIGSFLAIMCVNIIALVLVYVIAIYLTGLIDRALRIASRLPILWMLDSLGGFIVGALIGSFAVWAVVTLYLTLGVNVGLFNARVFNDSFVGQFLYEHGFLLTRFIYSGRA